MNIDVDVIIVGQGIAGTCMAFHLIQNNKSFVIIDEYQPNTSSRVALGVYNPLILKWFTSPWEIDSQINYFYYFYNKLNKFLDENLFQDTGLYKFLKKPYDQNNWLTKSVAKKQSRYMSSNLHTIDNPALKNNQYYGLIKKAGRLDVGLLLNTFRNYCISSNTIIQEQFNYKKILFQQDGVRYKNIHGKKIIFCEGFGVTKNPYFNNLNLKPTKGEFLIIHSKRLNLQQIIHLGFLVIPLADDCYAVGATYNWKDINQNCTMSARDKIISTLNNTIKVSYDIVEQKCGIRPSTVDRRGIVGVHPNHKDMYIMNGLGTRGVLLAPYLSNLLYASIYLNSIIPAEVNLDRLQ